jgi:hypothetical protein
MRVLLTESDAEASQLAADVLREAGHEVVRCTADEGGFPCRGVAQGDCPLDEAVDVAVSAPAGLPPEPEAGELGVVCALRRHIPLVVVSPDGSTWPASRYEVSARSDLVAACARAAAAPLPRHSSVAQDVVRQVCGDDATATVLRDGSRLWIRLRVPDGTDRKVLDAAAVRAEAAVRQVDRSAAIVDVTVEVH